MAPSVVERVVLDPLDKRVVDKEYLALHPLPDLMDERLVAGLALFCSRQALADRLGDGDLAGRVAHRERMIPCAACRVRP